MDVSTHAPAVGCSGSQRSSVCRVCLSCRVAVGEFCLGHNGQLTPDVRDNKRNLLYDSTTDNMDEKKRDMFVTYHDAQVNKKLTLYVLTIPLK